jgi:hypothetical protein
MRVRLLSLAAAGGIIAAVLPAHAASAPKPQVTDTVGDANAVNDQGFGSPLPNPSQSTAPADYAAGDLTSVLLQTTRVKKGKKKVANGFTATMNLAAAPDTANLYYVVGFSTPTCADAVMEFSTAPVLAANDAACNDAVDADPTNGAPVPFAGVSAKVAGNSIVWTFPASALHTGTALANLHAYVADGYTAFFYVDEAAGSATYTVGK